ncbi:MAG: PglZ domain-containing protein [Acidobacteria bacterium]|nr:PglZ domain-containing protein [Acidobacteriota bacterium]
MNPLHNYVLEQLSNTVSERRPITVWYDPRREFDTFVREWSGGDGAVLPVTLNGSAATLIRFDGSFLAVRAYAEPFVAADAPQPLVIYVLGRERDRRESLLMELEQSGTTWEPKLGNFARTVLGRKFSTGVVDEILGADSVTYEHLDTLAAQEEGAGSVLRAIYEDHSSNEALLAQWLVSADRDDAIEGQGAKGELLKLIGSRLGAPPFESGEPLPKVRTFVRRFVLGNEFRSDYAGPVAATIASLPKPENAKQTEFIRLIARTMRKDHPSAYTRIADDVERELDLARAAIDPLKLGSIDTFRFEEQRLLVACDDLIASGHQAEAIAIVAQREQSFWVNQQPRRRTQWEACRRVAELAARCAEARQRIEKIGKTPKAWLDAYANGDGLYRVDLAYRQMETFVNSMDEDAEVSRALGVQREEYDSLVGEMSRRFGELFAAAHFRIDGAFPQTSVHVKFVRSQMGRTAYFWVDALRFEMAAELRERLTELGDAQLFPAVAAIPTITPIGMAALLPGAEKAFDVEEEKGKLGCRVDGVFLPTLESRKKFVAARLPQSADILLGDVIQLSPAALKKRLSDVTLVIVRSTEIDAAGEGGFAPGARQAMDTVLGNLARAIRRLAAAGIENFVLSADHGHLFSVDKDDSMKIAAPGGAEVELHRRCWIGRGGKTPPGCIRVSAADLGYRSDLEFVFPLEAGVFKAGGDLAFHHGGLSLQELIVPVITLEWRGTPEPAKTIKGKVVLLSTPKEITTRMPTVEIGQGQMSLDSIEVRPVLLSGNQIVGKAEHAFGAPVDRERGVVSVGREKATVGIILHEVVQSVRIVLFDAATDAILDQSDEIPVKVMM